ncbi:21 kDa protein-like [Malania oleifera]|uniref:21 kDa protein-like n=1 Tax=Malania oleifera TaxID=397392 RepID=UPI0025AE7C67|nr:21 kDa protein-like [Malania oleifera]
MGISTSNHSIPLLLPLLATLLYSSAASRPFAVKPTTTEFIRRSCGATTYPRLCFASLYTHAGLIQTSPMLLADTALTVAFQTAQSAAAAVLRMSGTHGMRASEAAAVRDCVEEVGDSIDELRESLVEMKKLKGSNFEAVMSDVQTWVSAALTDDDTCTDGFAGKAMDGNVKAAVRGHILNIAHLTSNALALINQYASLHG